jgi:pimeloyl-ACP methyl ester carboxylesterase
MQKEIVLIHGWGGTKKSLDPLAKELKNYGYKTKVLELPGHGQTPEMDKPWNMQDYSNWLMQNIPNPENTILLGHSFGGRIILHTLINNSDFNQAILINSSGIKPKNSFKKSFWKIISLPYKLVNQSPLKGIFDPIRKTVYKILIGESDYIKTSGNMKKTFQIINEQYYNEENLKKISTKVLLIWGKEDKATPLWMGKTLDKNIKNSKLISVENATHGLPKFQPELVARLIKENL